MLYNKLSDMPIDYCYKTLNEFYESSIVGLPTQIDSSCREIIKSLMNYLNAKRNDQVNKKLEKLVSLILENHHSNSKGIILVRTRHHTKALLEYFETDKIKLKQIKPVVLTGQGRDEELAMSDQEQKKSIEKFRSDKANLMIATDIAQEGLDIPECNYVIRYNFVSNEIGTVQSRGRARAEKGKCFLITNQGIKYINFRIIIYKLKS